MLVQVGERVYKKKKEKKTACVVTTFPNKLYVKHRERKKKTTFTTLYVLQGKTVNLNLVLRVRLLLSSYFAAVTSDN